MQEQSTGRNHKWLVMAAVAAGIFLATIDGSIVNLALNTLEEEFHTDFAMIQWVTLAYMLTVITLMLSIGRLGDMLGKKFLYLAGFIVFTIGSGLCGLSNSIGMLITFRVVQAVGGAMTMALGTAILTEAFPPSERGKALGISGLMVSLGSISGPALGGLILESLSWHWIFFVNLPVGVIGVLMVWWFVPSQQPAGKQHFDIKGAAVMFVSLMFLLIGLTLVQTDGFSNPLVWGLLVGFIIFLGMFISIERSSSQPMVDLALFKNRLFSVNLMTGFMTFVCSTGLTFLIPFFMQNVLHYDTLKSGLLLGVVPLSMGIVAPISGSLSDRFGSRRLTVIGLLVLLAGYIAVSTLSATMSAWGFALRFLPIGIGMGLFQSPNNSAIMGTAPRHRLGVASGLLAITRNLGQISGIAVMNAIWAGQVVAYSSGPVADVTQAAAFAQVAGLHNTLFIIIGVIVVALLLSLWALREERRTANNHLDENEVTEA